MFLAISALPNLRPWSGMMSERVSETAKPERTDDALAAALEAERARVAELEAENTALEARLQFLREALDHRGALGDRA